MGVREMILLFSLPLPRSLARALRSSALSPILTSLRFFPLFFFASFLPFLPLPPPSSPPPPKHPLKQPMSSAAARGASRCRFVAEMTLMTMTVELLGARFSPLLHFLFQRKSKSHFRRTQQTTTVAGLMRHGKSSALSSAVCLRGRRRWRCFADE